MIRQQVILIAGASGVAGTAAVGHFGLLPDWQVIALSRRAPVVAAECRFTHVAIDLDDAQACKRLLSDIPAVSHLVYAAVAEAAGLVSGWRDGELIARNGRMFANLIGPLAASGALRHVSLLQGAKAYGAHVHPVTVPLREQSARDDHANFYWLHEDLLRKAAASGGFDFTIWRPQVILGTAPGSAMNPVAALGAYAAICRERKLPFVLPGAGDALLELTDAGLLAQTLEWAATGKAPSGQTFNITNGDVFVLAHIWDALAEQFGLPCTGPAPATFASFFSDRASEQAWDALARREDLVEASLPRLLGQSHHYLDLLTSARVAAKAAPALLSTIRLRQAGFAGCIDSQQALQRQLAQMAQLRLLPPF